MPYHYEVLRHGVTHEQKTLASQTDNLQATDLNNTIQPDGADVTGLSVGNCIEVTLDDALSSDTVPCTSVHRYEVVGFKLVRQRHPVSRTPRRWPLQATQDRAPGRSRPTWGIPRPTSKFTLVSTYPSPTQWAAGAHAGACLATVGNDRTVSVKSAHK